jgi:predicted nucleic acid-binding Zn ribbon protein
VKVRVSYAKCSFFASGLGPMECPLCKAVVPDGQRHVCEQQLSKPRKRKKRERAA